MRKIILIVFVLVCSVSPVSAKEEDGMTPSGISYTELKNRVDEYVSKYIGTSTAGANVVIVKDGEIFMNTSYGYAHIEKQIKVTRETVFEWGSVTKLLVWTSVMQLVEQEKLDLNEDIRTYLPDGFLTNLQFDAPITMMNLMHHNAGWEERYIDLFYTSANDIKPLEEMLHITKPNQVYEPGSVVAYSNYGVALAGFIVERLSGQPFHEYVNDHIFSVLNMKDTSIHPTQQDNLNIATNRDSVSGYLISGEGEPTTSKNERIYIGLYPAGSAMGTIADITKFMMALMPADGEDSPLFQNKRTLEKMLTTSDFYDNDFPRNAHGFWKSLYAVDVLGHAGNTDSFSSNFIFSKENKLGLIVMTNQKNEIELTYGLPTLLFGEYSAGHVNQTLPNVPKHEGSYYWARQPYNGFAKLYGVLSATKIEVTERNHIFAFKTNYEQIVPFLFKSTDGSNDYLHVTLNNGQVEKISTLTSDMLPVSQSSKVMKLLSILAIIFSIVYTVITLLISLFQFIKKRKKTVQTTVSKWASLLLIANIIAVMNVIFLFYRALNYTPYAALTIHFWINYAYVVTVAVCIITLFLECRKITTARNQKIHLALSCVSAILLVILIFGWEVYY